MYASAETSWGQWEEDKTKDKPSLLLFLISPQHTLDVQEVLHHPSTAGLLVNLILYVTTGVLSQTLQFKSRTVQVSLSSTNQQSQTELTRT